MNLTITNKIENRPGERFRLPKATRDGVPVTMRPTLVWNWSHDFRLRCALITAADLKPFFGCGPDWSFRSGYGDDSCWTIHFSFGSEASALRAILNEVDRNVYHGHEKRSEWATMVKGWRRRLRQLESKTNVSANWVIKKI
jgi:hypothetical protein